MIRAMEVGNDRIEIVAAAQESRMPWHSGISFVIALLDLRIGEREEKEKRERERESARESRNKERVPHAKHA